MTHYYVINYINYTELSGNNIRKEEETKSFLVIYSFQPNNQLSFLLPIFQKLDEIIHLRCQLFMLFEKYSEKRLWFFRRYRH